MHLHTSARFRNGIVFILLVLAGMAFLAPFAWMISTSLKPVNETMTLPPALDSQRGPMAQLPRRDPRHGIFLALRRQLALPLPDDGHRHRDQFRAGRLRLRAHRVAGPRHRVPRACWRR